MPAPAGAERGSRRRRVRTAACALAAVVAAVGVGCDGAPRPSSECRDLDFGCVILGPGEPVRLATLLGGQGNAAVSVDTRNAVELAVEERGEVAARPVEILDGGEGCDAEAARVAASRLALDVEPVSVIGPLCSSAALPALSLLGFRGILAVSPSASRPDLTAPGSGLPFFARTAHNDRVQGDGAARFAASDLRARTAVTVSDGGVYAEAMVERFRTRFAAMGGAVIEDVRLDVPTEEAARRILDAIEAPHVLFLPLEIEAGAAVVRAARSLRSFADTELIGAHALFGPEFYERAGERAVDGMYIAAPDTLTPDDYEPYARFRAAYERRFGEDLMSVYGPRAYDAATIVLDSVERVAIREDGDLMIPRKALRDAVFATTGHRGISGTITCDRFGDCGAPIDVCVITITHADDIPMCYPAS